MNPTPIPKVLDLTRTQFLPTDDPGFFRKFKRRRVTVLVDATNTPLRLMNRKGWQEFAKDREEAVKSAGLSLRIVWVLEEIRG